MKRYILFVLLILSTTVNAESQAEKLTTLGLNKVVSSDSLEVKRMQSAFDRNLKVCKFKNESQLSNSVWIITKGLRKKGIYAEPIDIVEGINSILFEPKEKQDCVSILALYSVNRQDGQTHSDVIAGIMGIYRDLGVID